MRVGKTLKVLKQNMPIAGKPILDSKPVAENALFIAVSSTPKLEEKKLKLN